VPIRFPDRVQETSTVTGTGDATLLGAAPRSRTFAQALFNFCYTIYCVDHQTQNEWEVGLGQWTGTVLRRVQVISSSNSNALVSFSAGTKNVFCCEQGDLVGQRVQQLYRYKNDFEAITADQAMNSQVSGTGAANVALGVVLADNAVGLVRSNLGSTTTGRSAFATTNMSILNLANGLASFASRGRVVTLSDATNTYIFRIGFLDSVIAEPTDGVFFRYTNGVNSGQYVCVARSNGVETAVNTSVLAAANTFVELDVVVENSTRASFYINDSRVAEITTNIPAVTGRELGFGKATIRSAGAATSLNDYDIDYIDVMQWFKISR
jgi:hypothetical protein